MSINALASAYASPPRGAAPPPVGATRAETPSTDASSSRSEAAQRSRRNPLMDAMLSANGAGNAQRSRASSDQPVDGAAKVQDALKADSGAADEAVAQFAHALMDDLRTLAGSGEAKGWSDLSGSVAALAVKAGASETSSTDAESAVPPQPNPLTPTSAAVHLMQVPSSHLMKAYAAMRQAMPQADPADVKAADPADAKARDPAAERAQLAQFLEKISQSLAPQATEAPSLNGLGTLLDTRA